MINVRGLRILEVADRADLPARRMWQRPSVLDEFLQLLFPGIGEVETGLRKELDAVIGKNIMGSGDDGSQIHLQVTGQVGNPGSRQDSGKEDLGAARSRTGSQGCFNQ